MVTLTLNPQRVHGQKSVAHPDLLFQGGVQVLVGRRGADLWASFHYRQV